MALFSDQNNKFKNYVRYVLLFFMCSFAATFYMVEAKIALIHIQLLAIIVLSIVSALITPPTHLKSFSHKSVLIGMSSMWLCFFASIIVNGEFTREGFIVLNGGLWLWVLPLIFFIIPTLSKRETLLVISSYFLGITVLVSVAVYRFTAIKLGLDHSFAITNHGIIDPDIIPFKIFHHTISIYLGLGIVLAVLLLQFYREFLTKLTLSLIIALIGLFVFYIFLISARIGFVTILFLLVFYSYRIFIFLPWKWHLKLALVVGLLVLISSIVYFNPNTQRRIQVTLGEINRTDHPEKNIGENMSARLLAYKVSTNLLLKFPWNGVSFTNENSEYMREYQEAYNISPDMHPFAGNPLKPHTEFYRYMVVLGIPIGTIFIISYFSLFFVKKNRVRFDYWLFLGVFSLYMMTDFPFHLKEVFYLFCFFMPFWTHLMQSLSKESTTLNVDTNI